MCVASDLPFRPSQVPANGYFQRAPGSGIDFREKLKTVCEANTTLWTCVARR